LTILKQVCYFDLSHKGHGWGKAADRASKASCSSIFELFLCRIAMSTQSSSGFHFFAVDRCGESGRKRHQSLWVSACGRLEAAHHASAAKVSVDTTHPKSHCFRSGARAFCLHPPGIRAIRFAPVTACCACARKERRLSYSTTRRRSDPISDVGSRTPRGTDDRRRMEGSSVLRARG
jgi:hypothetical protein